MAITDGRELIDPALYAENGPPHETWTALRRESPIHWCEPSRWEPFWAVTRHQDIIEISKSPDRFLSEPGIVVTRPEDRAVRDSGEGLGAMRVLIETDPPEHRQLRKVSSSWFTPRAIGRLDETIDGKASGELYEAHRGPGRGASRSEDSEGR